MKSKFKIIPLFLTVVLTLLAIGAESVYLGDFEFRYRTRKFSRILREKEKIMDSCIYGMKPILAKGESHGSLSESDLFSIAEKNRITILEYFGNKLTYWSDNDFDVPLYLNDSLFTSPLVFIQNGWFLTETVQAGNEKIVGLLRLRSDYGFENDIIKNGFLKDYGVSGNVGFSRDKNASGFQVFTSDGTFLFCLLFPEVKVVTLFIVIPLLLWGLSFIFLIWLTLEFVKYLVNRNRNAIALMSCGATFLTLYIIILLTRRPAVIFLIELFSPYRYTMNPVIPSLGHLTLLSVLLAVFSWVMYLYLPVREKITEKRWSAALRVTMLFIPGVLSFTLYQLVFSHLIFSSNINFETFKVLDLNLFSLTGFLSLALLFCLPMLYVLKVFHTLKHTETKTIVYGILISSLVFPAFFSGKPEILLSILLFYYLITAAVWFFGQTRTGLFNQTVIFALIFALYSLFLITELSEKKTEENIKIQLVTYSTENDPLAEHLLLDMWPQISRDSLLRQLMNVAYFEKSDVDKISDYLHTKYFTGYWGNFTFNIVLCMREDTLRIGESNERYEDCFRFFDDKILLSGHQLTGTGFYFMENNLGRSNYLGKVYFNYGNGRYNGLFIDLYSDINVFQPGYSEILLDKKYHSYARLKEYSFAKYINGELVLSTGDFQYDKTDTEYLGRDDYRLFDADSFRHVLYRNGNVTVIISKPAITAQDIIISFAYLFAFILIFSNLMFLLIKKPSLKTPGGLNFRQKLQLSFISILLVSFTLIGIVIASLAIKQSQTKHYENVKEKLNSVYVELESRLFMETRLPRDWRTNTYSSLNELLVNLSNIFNTDINLYDLSGYLLATSRPEIFYRNLTSHRMNNMAFTNFLVNLNRSDYFQEEKVGNLGYLSAYRPFYNRDNQVLTYLNLPYFRLQSVLAKEISNMIVAVINFTLLLIVIAMSLAVFISSRLTAPLALISSRLASVELGKKSEHLSYKGSDEVGDLVRQYNRMVDELDESAQKLARSERESAWREMAKQIAHEIKNPLTPMKLNVQQLFKSWKDGVPGFEKKLEKFTKNQIEYIDNLSSIASAFSSFAKIPEPVPVNVDLMEQITTTLELFKNTDKITFRIGWPHPGKLFIHADREQVNGIFSNLIKNSIQSIPADREGIIKVSLEEGINKVVVSVADNGVGIPESLKKKMFTPNFTTKSSGTGLGLSIVKRYVESAGGRIWFESEENKGAVFFVEFPLISSERKS
ncbi:MAG: HAMP domain-containing sensor histidine kinase [Bacteroidales bacterium]